MSCRSTRTAAGSSVSTPGCWGRPANGLRIRLRRVLPATEGSYRTILDAGCGSGVFSYELAKRHPEAKVARHRQRSRAGRPGQRDRVTAPGSPTASSRRVTSPGWASTTPSTWSLSVDNLEHVDDDIEAMRTLLHALRPGGGWWSMFPVTSADGYCLGRRVNFDVPGHVRPGYRAEELVGKLRKPASRSAATATPTGCSKPSPTTSPT